MLRFRSFVVALLFLSAVASAHVGVHPSVHDTVAGVMDRMRETVPAEKLVNLTPAAIVEFLTEEEKEILGQEHIVFTVNVPVVVSVLKDVRLVDEPYWLPARGFEKIEGEVKTSGEDFEIWQKAFPAGEIGLGINTFTGAGDHYFVMLAPQEAGAKIEVTDIYPGQLNTGTAAKGERVFVGWDDSVLVEMPSVLEGQVVLRTDMDNRRDARLTDIFRLTLFPATEKIDQVTLTWSDDPRKSQAVQWRTSTEVDAGAARVKEEGAEEWHEVQAETHEMKSASTVNDPLCNRHSAVFRGLKPATTYVYEVGTGEDDGWQAGGQFITAPDEVVPFKFVYMGDAQNGLEAWGKLVHKAHADEPEAAFYIMAGDLVNRGNERDDWDLFFDSAAGVYNNKTLVPCIGNHEVQGSLGPRMYLELFDLLDNGPENIEKERAYSFEYSNALFVVLDSNLEPASQAEWLDEQLSKSDKTWKFLVYHHPLYSAGENRDNPELRKVWGDIFDKYHVDVALQGHDHSYLRTYPMKAGERVASPAEGTIYIISVSGTKLYDQGPHDYTEVGFTNIPVYQLLDIQIDGDQLTYKSFDVDGNLKDEFIIEK